MTLLDADRNDNPHPVVKVQADLLAVTLLHRHVTVQEAAAVQECRRAVGDVLFSRLFPTERAK